MSKYSKKWNKENLVQVNAKIYPEFRDRLRDFLKKHDMSLPRFLKEALDIMEKEYEE